MPATSAKQKIHNLIVVDDNKDIRDLIMGTLCRMDGFRCEHTFADADSLLAHLGKREVNSPDLPDVIVLDWSMPGMTTKTAIEIIHVGWPRVKMVVFTALPRCQVLPVAIDAGAAEVVEKHEGIQGLVDALKRLAPDSQ